MVTRIAFRNMPMIWILLVVTFTLAGCAGTTDKGKSYYVYKNTAGNEILTDMPCGNAVDPCNKSMRDARVTNNHVDEEFWQFEARVQVRSLVGIPYGRMPQDFNVIGPKERCESARATVTDPTEPCKGPFHFRRD
jgi:hypothetical protein